MQIEKKYASLPVISIVSMLVTYFLNHDLRLGAVIAASLVGLAAGFLFKNALFAVASYSAAFVGMSSKALIPEWYFLIPAGLIHAIVVIAMMRVFTGWGGKAGTMGFTAVALTSIILLFIEPVNYTQPNPLGMIASFPIDVWVVGIIAGVAGIMLTLIVREKAHGGPRGNDAVIGSATVALIGGIVATTFSAAPFNYANFAFIAPIIASGTYAGMAARKVLPKTIDFLIVGVLLGVLNVALWPIFPGFGGRLGTIGLISCAIWILIIKLRKPKAA